MGFSLSRSAAPTAAIGATPAQTASKRKRAYRFTNIHVHRKSARDRGSQGLRVSQGFASRRQRIAAKLTAGSGNDDTPGACRTGTGMSRLALVVAGFPASGKTLLLRNALGVDQPISASTHSIRRNSARSVLPQTICRDA